MGKNKKTLAEQVQSKLNSGTTKPKHLSDVDQLKQDLLDLNLLKIKKKKNYFKMLLLFPAQIIKTLVSVRDVKSPRALANRLFSNIILIYPEYFTPLKKTIEDSDMRIIPETYVGVMTAVASVAAAITFGAIVATAFMLNLSFVIALFGCIVVPFSVFSFVFLLFYIYPFQKISQKKRSIDTNMPFAINHMAAIASSGVPPEKAFEMLVEFGSYGGITEESKTIVRRIKVLGEDITTSLHYVAERTPSESFKELLYGILAIIESGGNLKEYLNEMAEIALFNYKLERKKYVETLSTYADIYTVILIAAPMFLVSILAVMNIVPGSNVGGMSIDAFLSLGVYILIPLMNVGFIAFLTYTQPDI